MRELFWNTMDCHVHMPSATLLTFIGRHVEPSGDQSSHTSVEFLHVSLEHVPVGHVFLIGEGEEGIHTGSLTQMAHADFCTIRRTL
ncbi:hypothetical protein AX13_08980 [Comamonas aquatica DA1877]|uniref:Uncharacterized protein n=1 Tax=Comamonas aquatica DA1877 TaxID=1457173 RepID=A0A014MLF6_9BURK|nr:hypothetical protein AX13_08980 [Comamonas aquatica DA1877]